MKRLLLILLIATGLTITGCGADDSEHSHGEGADHSHETEQQVSHNETDETHQHENEEEHGHPHETADSTDTESGSKEEHSHSGEEAHTHEGEDSGMMLGIEETYDEVRKGVRLTLSYNSETSSFSGTVENTTQDVLPPVAVGVELSNGTELGPTAPVDLAAGESQTIELDAAGETFDSWSAHSEMGSNGHSHGENGDHEH